MTRQGDRQKSRDRGQDGKFKTGHAKRGGRKAGTQNLASDIATSLVAASAVIGSDEKASDGLQKTLSWIALSHPKIFVKSLEKLLPVEYLKQRVQKLEKQLKINR